MIDELKLGTLAFPVKDGRVLLGLKKRKHGEGKWNGFGGKALPGEEIETTMLRELTEEAGIVATQFKRVGKLTFANEVNDMWGVVIYLVTGWEGQIVETEEMLPQWYPIDSLPFESMWPDDAYWLPHVLDGEVITGEFVLDDQGGLDTFKLDFVDSV